MAAHLFVSLSEILKLMAAVQTLIFSMKNAPIRNDIHSYDIRFLGSKKPAFHAVATEYKSDKC